MPPFQRKTVSTYNNYITPKCVWKSITNFIPKDKVLWEAFYCEGSSGRHLADLGFKVIHKNINFYDHNLGDIIISNPPFETKRTVYTRLKQLDKPFIMLSPADLLSSQYFIDLFGDTIQLIIPRKRIRYQRVEPNGSVGTAKRGNFNSYYYCYKMNLPRDITYVDLENFTMGQKKVR